MNSVNIYSEKEDEIKKFLELYYSTNININTSLKFKKNFANPIDMIDLISCFADNSQKFKISVWISIDENVYIRVSDQNINSIIKYLYERYPW